ncbi:glycosyltransferase family 2 protein [Lyngbya sp. CCAP 1446/10]|uniref:glycosyltransferase family 2 protein n=1 Tax=Microcoleaceae TaxID=1892252 RepID=UPI0022381ACA|nr:glycosyltransferase family A protein [Lyngbya sp. CCAP 1446/10]MCW6051442.1 glycosyltransferase family 2 protein [Lyngbya sp. CCAP 1446/10]
MENLTVSVIIPTHNRSVLLLRALDALQSQTYPLDLIEVIVVADSCIDDTLAVLKDYKAPFKLLVIEEKCRAASITRNTGAASATGKLVLFIDDDIEPTPPLIESHVRIHQERPGCVVIGPYPPKFQGGDRFFDVEVRAWWEEKFYQMRQPDHRHTYEDLLTGNLSLETKMFASTGGFDAGFGQGTAHEDYEFGLRLLKANIPFAVAADAVGYHYEHETNNLSRSFRRAREEGRSDVLLGQRHPELKPTLHIKDYETPYSFVDRVFVALVFYWPAALELLAVGLRRSLDWLEAVRMRGTWRWLTAKLRGYWYLRGVMDELKTRSGISTFMEEGPIRADLGGYEIEIDLQQGLEAAEHRIDAERPAGIYLYYGKLTIGHISPEVGAEPLRGVHLRRILAQNLAEPLARAMAVNGMPCSSE